jgi:hypothetical protein
MDKGSRATLVEFAVILAWLAWATAIAALWPAAPARDLEFVLERFGTLCLVAATLVGVVAWARREPIGGARLNRWDEAVGFWGADCLADLAVLL